MNYSKIGVFFGKASDSFTTVHTTLEDFENKTTAGHSEFVFEENRVRKVVKPSFSKTQLLACLKNPSSMRSVLEN